MGALKDLPRLSEKFVVWRGNLLDLTETVFGKTSDQVLEVKAVKVESPPDLLESAEKFMRSSPIKPSIESTEDRYFNRHLDDFSELILSFILSLEGRK
jgi:hypothetical protein